MFIHSKSSEKGNVLFLILIAVALFAALSYAVTQSTRSGGGSSERERSILSSASMTQHPTALRTSILRMVLAGTSVQDVKFNAPTDAAFATEPQDELVFHPNGGAAVFQNADADLMSGGTPGTWVYNASWDVPGIGLDGAGGNDIIAFLPGVSQGICEQINDEFAIDVTNCTTTAGATIPDLDAATTEANLAVLADDTYTFPITDQENLQGAGATCAAFTSQPSGCFWDTDGSQFVFYSVVLER